jgi:hypothetical protein
MHRSKALKYCIYSFLIIGPIVMALAGSRNFKGPIWDAPIYLKVIGVLYALFMLAIICFEFLEYYKRNKVNAVIAASIIPISLLIIWVGYRIRFGEW